MKKLYFLSAALVFSTLMMAQVSVTFSLNLGDDTASELGVHLAGNFNVNGDNYPEFAPDGIAMSDLDMDNIWEVELMLSPGDYEFKYINGNDWGMDEGVPEACIVPGSFNRGVTVGTDPVVVPTVCFAQCADCGMRYVLFQVDMSLEDAINPNGVHVAGSFQGWDPAATEMLDGDGDGIYTYAHTYMPEDEMMADELTFKYINDNAFAGFEETVSGDCADDEGNRLESISEANTVLTAYCFGTCGSCVSPTSVTFQVDMSLEDVGPNGVHIAGAFQGWDPGATQMTDDNSDNIYEVTLELAPGTYEYKHVNGNTWDDPNESTPAECNTGGNRSIVIEEVATQTVLNCYNQCTADCVQDPDDANITFRIDMTDTPVSADGLYLIGGFTNPAWQAGATEMTDVDADGIYEATLLVGGSANIQYKFVNGDLANPDFEENDGLVECGIENGVGGYNRLHTRSGEDEILDIACFNVCECIVSVEEISLRNALSVYPNPAENLVNVSFNGETVQNIRLINSLGQTVLELDSEITNGTQLDVSGLTSGIYSLQLLKGNISVDKTIMIK